MVRERLWFFAGYQYLRDYDSQPGADPTFPRTYERTKIFGKLAGNLSPRWQLMQSFHEGFWVNAERPTVVTPFEATTRPNATVPAMTFGHLTHTVSPNTLWDVRVGRSATSRTSPPSTGDTSTTSRFDRATGVTSGAPREFGGRTLHRTNAKATLNHYMPALWGADHQWKVGGQVERGEHYGPAHHPDRRALCGQRQAAVSGDFAQSLHREVACSSPAAAFVSDAITVGDRLTINAGLRFDHSQSHQPGSARDRFGRAGKPTRSFPGWARCPRGTCSRRAWASR